MRGWLSILAIGTAAVGALVALDRLALWAEARGWIYWRRTRRRTGAGLADAFLEVQSLIEPEKRHVLVERRRTVDPGEAESDPPEPGASTGASPDSGEPGTMKRSEDPPCD